MYSTKKLSVGGPQKKFRATPIVFKSTRHPSAVTFQKPRFRIEREKPNRKLNRGFHTLIKAKNKCTRTRFYKATMVTSEIQNVNAIEMETLSVSQCF